MGAPENRFDVSIVGAGILGVAVAEVLARRRPEMTLAVIEKEDEVAHHQSGRNSGVLHSGIYYTPGSKKATLCRAGREKMLAFCEREGVPYELCGKVVVAVRDEELPRLEKLAARAKQNGAHSETLDSARLGEREPHVAGVAALYVPEAGIVDFAAVTRRLAERVRQRDEQRLVLGARLRSATERGSRIVLETDAGSFESNWVVNCAGLQSDRVARMLGQAPPITIVPFRGDYYVLGGPSKALVKHLVYPVPDPGLPFLGVHATRTTSGTIECGPNASLALGREAYDRLTVDPTDLSETLAFPGLWRLAMRFRSVAVREFMRSLSKRAFHRALTLLVPSARLEDLEPRAAGIRAQAMTRDGTLVDDFVIVESERVVSVCNAPSPAATASLAIAESIADRLLARAR